MSTKFLSPGWRMPRNANQSKSTNYSLDFIPTDIINVSGFSTALSNVNNGTRSSDNNLPFSWSVWFKSRNSSNSQGEIAGYGQSQRNGIRIHNNVFRSNYTSDLAGTTTISQNIWYHGVVTYDGTTRKIYINGVLDASDTPSSAAISNQPLTIGVYPGGTSSFNGELNELCFFDYALSESQVTTLYGTGSAIGNPMALPSSPIAYYPLGTSAWNGQYLAENNAIGDYVFDFNNSQDINCGNNSALQMDTVFTMSCWINTTSTSRGSIMGTYVSGGSGYYIDLMPSGTVQGGYHSTGSHFLRPSSSTVNDGNWHHICYVISGTATDGSDLDVYVDGQLDNGSFTSSGTPSGAVTTNPFKINLPGYSGRYTGETSNVQLFNTALSGPEVETLYNYGSPIQTLANIPQSSNLKAWYKLDASEIYNSTSTEWEVNNALSPWTSSLNLIPNDYIDCGNDSSLSISGDLTLSAWVKINNYDSYNAVISKIDSSTRNYEILIRPSIPTGGISFYVANSSFITSTGTVPLNTWTHIVVTVESGVTNGAKIYINGSQDATTGTLTINSNTANLNIGRRTTGSFYMDGKMSNAQIFNTALPATGSNSVETLYNSGTPLADMSSFSSLVSWWKLDNTTTGIEDSKGSNNGTNNGATEAPGSVSTLNGESTGMSQSNLVQSDLQTVAPYSKYAMNFDGNDDIGFGNITNLNSENFTASIWVYHTTTGTIRGIWGTGSTGYNDVFLQIDGDDNYNWSTNNLDPTWVQLTTPAGPAYTWNHITCVRSRSGNLTTRRIYVNGSIAATDSTSISAATGNTTLLIGKLISNGYYLTGKMSNFSIWNTALTPSQVREIYNEGLPSNLHNFSGTAPAAWWQLGENSSFNGNDWICADEIGSSNGESDGMGVDALTNGVGTTANGSSTGMSEGSLVGDAPYSTGNAISSGMPVTARGTDVPS
jgi:hypothetical protein